MKKETLKLKIKGRQNNIYNRENNEEKKKKYCTLFLNGVQKYLFIQSDLELFEVIPLTLFYYLKKNHTFTRNISQWFVEYFHKNAMIKNGKKQKILKYI